MSFWELVIFVLGLACPRTGILPFFYMYVIFPAHFQTKIYNLPYPFLELTHNLTPISKTDP